MRLAQVRGGEIAMEFLSRFAFATVSLVLMSTDEVRAASGDGARFSQARLPRGHLHRGIAREKDAEGWRVTEPAAPHIGETGDFQWRKQASTPQH